MWQILKSELEYNSYVLIGMYVVAFLLFVLGLHGGGGVYNAVPNTLVPFFIGYALLSSKSCKESRTRQHSLLPQSRTEYGMTRMLFFGVILGGVFLLWLVAYVVGAGNSPEAIWMMLSVNALMLTFMAVRFIFDDTRSGAASITTAEGWTAPAIARRVTGIITFGAIIVSLIVAAAGSGEQGITLLEISADWGPELALRNFLRGPMGAFAMNVVFMIAFYLSVRFSLPRRSFASR